MKTDNAVFFDFHEQLGLAAIVTAQENNPAERRRLRAPTPLAVARMIHYPGPMRLTPVFPTSAHHRGALLIVLTVIAALSACGGHSNVRSSSSRSLDTHWPVVPASDPAAANAVVMRALSLVGIPYRYGGNTPESGFDCSGLINYIYQDMLDLRLPRTSRELAQIQGPKLPQKQLAAGDLVFFGNRGQVNHVGIYIGEGRFVHAPSNGGTVRLDMLDGTYWRDNYTGAKRVLY